MHSIKKGLPLILISLLPSCKKDMPAEQTYYSYLSASLKSYMFIDGSYWVYENDSTGVSDSIAVTGTSHGFFIESPAWTGQEVSQTRVECYKINLSDALASAVENNFLLGNIVSINGNENGVTHMGQPVLLAHAPVGDKVSGAEVWDTLSILNAGGNTFYNVEVMKINYLEQAQQEFSHNTYLYFADSIGLVRKEIDLGNGSLESWSLKRWHTSL
jgi:hypothetical protein